MELRVLNYFLAICREGSITKAAEALHVSQPALSRQLKDMEEELGKPLVIRGSRTITLTDEGILLRKRAGEILELADRTKEEIALSGDAVAGDIYIGAGETQLMHNLTLSMHELRKQFSDVRFHISSGDTRDVYDELDKGLIDFGMVFGPIEENKYHFIELPGFDIWGVYMRADAPLACRNALSPQDLHGLPLIIPRHSYEDAQSAEWFANGKFASEDANVAATYSLIFNAIMMVKDGLGYAIGLGGLADVSTESGITFVPIQDSEHAVGFLIWKKYQVLSKAAEAYLKTFDFVNQ